MRTYPAGSQIPISDVGESTPTSGGALVCRTDRDDCCRNDPQAGEIRALAHEMICVILING